GPGRGADAVPAGNVRKVNSTRISLNYKVDDVGPSGLSVVEVWMTRNTQDWRRFAEEKPQKTPLVVDVPGEGRYGFTLLAKSGVALGEQPPRPGEQPQVWVEVDLTRPSVTDLHVVVGRGADTGRLFITWRASDKNLSQRPMSLFYSDRPDGEWKPVPDATGIENTGRFVWNLPPTGVPYKFYVRVEALDEAGNVGEAKTPDFVKVDLSLPRARVIGIEPAKP